MNRAGAETPGWSTKQVLCRSDGSWFHTEYSSYPVFDAGVVQGAVVTFVDITERSSSELMSA